MHVTILTGHDAITYAENHGSRVKLNKYADPTEGAREDVDLYDAHQIASEDPLLIWCDGPSYSVDLDALTVIATDENGERHDLNARGEPCADLADLRAFIRELCAQGAYTTKTRDLLLSDAA